jgi:L-fuconate dehydratase
VSAKGPIFPVITSLETFDVRFPTSRHLDGSDAMNPDPDYSAAYAVIRTDAGDGLEGHGFAFTIGRGNDVQVAAIRALEPFVIGLPIDETLASMGDIWRTLVHDSQLRWLGPEKGVMHMAISAVINALWDLAAKRAGKPLWKLLAEMSPEELVALVDFRYLTDALTPDEALAILRRAQSGRAERTERLLEGGYPAYTTTPGWLGYADAKLARLCEEAVEAGYEQVKLKVGANLEDDVRRMGVAREACGPGVRIAVDANQRWDVDEAVRWIRALEPHDPWWVEEPTSPDDVLGHAAIRRGVRPVRIATGEHVQNRVVFKQLMQAEAIDIVQIDAARVAGVNENIAILLLAAKFGLPVCPHAGGVGLCELVQHLSMFDYIAVSGTLEDRVIEYVDHLHEHFVAPVVIRDGRYRAPIAPGFSAELKPDALAAHLFPGGAAWVEPAMHA